MVAEHAWKMDHPISWSETSVLDRAKRHDELLLKVALHIQTAARGSNFNRDGGIELHECWTASIKRCEGRSRRWRVQTCAWDNLAGLPDDPDDPLTPRPHQCQLPS